jgi:hypothetical protein
MNTLPNLLIVGAPRCGTSHAGRVLNSHPKVWINQKWPKECVELARRDPANSSGEIHFFSTAYYHLGIDFYKKFFDGIYYDEDADRVNPRVYSDADRVIPTFKYIGEKSPSYCMWNPEPRKRIKEHLKDVKLILCVREPVQRTHSQWVHLQDLDYGQVWDHYVGLPFSESIKPHQLHHWLPQNSKHSNLILQGTDYAYMYSELINLFGKDSVYVLVNEETKLNPMKEYLKLFKWLGLKPPKYQRQSAGLGALSNYINFSNYQKYGYLAKEDEKYLKKYFREMKDEFYNLLGREIKVWEL